MQLGEEALLLSGWAGCQQVVLGLQEGKKIALDCGDLEGGHWN